jgi:hypothetical protein
MKKILYLNFALLLGFLLIAGCQSTGFPSLTKSKTKSSAPTSDQSLYNKVPASMKADAKEAEFDFKESKGNVNTARKKLEVSTMKKERSALQEKYAKYDLDIAETTQKQAEVNVDLKQWEAIDAAGLGDKEKNINTIGDLTVKKLDLEKARIKSKASLDTTAVQIKKLSKKIRSLENKIK